MINLKEKFLQKEGELTAFLQTKYDEITKELKIEINQCFGGSEFSISVLSFVFGNSSFKNISLLDINSNIKQKNIVNESGINLHPVFFDKNCLPLFDSPIVNLLKTNMSYNYQQIAYCPFSKKLVYTLEFLNFLDTNKIFNINGKYSIDDSLANTKIASMFEWIIYNKEEESNKSALYLFIEDELFTSNNRRKPNYINSIENHDESFGFSYSSSYEPIIKKLDNPHFLIRNDTLFFNISNESHPLIFNYRFLSKSEENNNKLAYLKNNISWIVDGSKRSQELKVALVFSMLFKTLSQKILNKAIEKDFNTDLITSLNSFMNEHRRVQIQTERLIKLGWSVQNICLLLKKFKEQKHSIIGYFENYSNTCLWHWEENQSISSEKYISDCFNEVTDSFWKERRKGDRKLVDPIDISFLNDSSVIKELTSSVDLEIEGEDMNHCVGGYANTIKSTLRIFHININNNHSTLEMSLNASWKIIQHRGRSNTTPNKLNDDFALSFLKELNERHNTVKVIQEFSDVLKFDTIRDSTVLEPIVKRMTSTGNMKNFFKSDSKFIELLKYVEEHDKILSLTLERFNNQQMKTVHEFLSNIISLIKGEAKTICVITNSNFQGRDSYKRDGFSWYPEGKVWWRVVSIKQVKDINPSYTIQLESLDSDSGKKKIDNLKMFRKTRTYENRITPEQRQWIKELS